MTSRRWLGSGLWVVGALVGTPVHAAQTVHSRLEPHWGLRVEANTDFPLGVGGRLAVVSPLRLYLTASVDAMLPAYARAVTGVATSVGYSQTKADYIQHGLQGSLSWRAHLGWQPFPASGFYFEAGYGQLLLGGQVNPEDALVSVLNVEPPAGETADSRQYLVRALVHQVDVELGWRWKFGETSPWSIRAALGGSATLQSKTRIEPRFTPTDPSSVDAFTQGTADKADSYFKKYGYVPSVSLSVGYTF